MIQPQPDAAAQQVLDRATSLAAESGTSVTPALLAQALAELDPVAVDDVAAGLYARLFDRIGRTNQLLAALNTHFVEAINAMSTVADLKTAADALAANEAALATEVTSLTNSVEALVVVVNNLRATGTLSTADQATLDAAVQEVTDSSVALAGETQNLAREQASADAAANPPAPPA